METHLEHVTAVRTRNLSGLSGHYSCGCGCGLHDGGGGVRKKKFDENEMESAFELGPAPRRYFRHFAGRTCCEIVSAELQRQCLGLLQFSTNDDDNPPLPPATLLFHQHNGRRNY